MKPRTDRERKVFFNGFTQGIKAGKIRMFEEISLFLKNEISKIEAELEGREGK